MPAGPFGVSTGSDAAVAARLTGPGAGFLPLPARRSGCVSTMSGLWPAASSASRMSAAKAGVPANAIDGPAPGRRFADGDFVGVKFALPGRFHRA